MKIALIVSASLAGLLPATQIVAATAVAPSWQAELNIVQQASSQDSAARTRAEATLAAVLDATRNGLKAEAKTIQATESAPTGANLDAASAQAAYSTMASLYPTSGPALDAWLTQSLAEVNDSASAVAAGRKWGEHVAQVTLTEPSDIVFPHAGTFAESVQPPASPAPAPEVRAAPSAEQAAIGPDMQAAPLAALAPIGPGRYQFSNLAGSLTDYDAWYSAGFDNPGGMAADASGNVYLSEQDTGTIVRISPDGFVSSIAGGAVPATRFLHPLGVAVDNAGNVLVADYGNATIRKIDPSGNVTTVAGTSSSEGDADGDRASARLYHPSYIAVDASGNLFVTQDALYGSNLATSHALIRKIAPDGTVSSIRVPFPAARSFYAPDQVCVDHAGNVYMSVVFGYDGNLADALGVLRLTPTGETGRYEASELVPPEGYNGGVIGISLDQNDSLLIRSGADPFHLYSPTSGWQTRFPSGISDLGSIKQVAFSQSGKVYALETTDVPYGIGAVSVGAFNAAAEGPVLLSQPWDDRIRAGDNGGFWVIAAGGPGLTYQWYFDSTPINGATTPFLTIPNAQSADAGSHYSVVVSDGAGSVTSRKAYLSVSPAPQSGSGSSASGTSTSGTGTSSSGSGSGSVSSGSGSAPGSESSGGGGSLDPRSSLLVLLLLAARKLRRRASKCESATRT